MFNKGGIRNEQGLEISRDKRQKESTGSVVGFEQSEGITNEELLELDMDILIPAALENVITIENVRSLKARIVAEFANRPTPSEADEVLYGLRCPVVPDFLCNGSGVISYFEMVQNLTLDHWDENEIYRRLKKKMTTAIARSMRVHECTISPCGRRPIPWRSRTW